MSVSLPVSCVVIVERERSDEEWRIAYVERLDCSASKKQIEEQMDDLDIEELERLANAAKDLP